MGVNLQFGFNQNPFANAKQNKESRKVNTTATNQGFGLEQNGSIDSALSNSHTIEAIPFSFASASHAFNQVGLMRDEDPFTAELTVENGWTSSQASEYTPFPYWMPKMDLGQSSNVIYA